MALPRGVTVQRIRIHFVKGEELRFTGHLDLHKIWERTFRRAHLPLAYSQGFHPQPRIQLACALPLGFTSTAEMVDVWLDTAASSKDIERILAATVQPGLAIESIESIPLNDTSLQNRVVSVVYRIDFLDPADQSTLQNSINLLLTRESAQRERRGKTYDLRALVEDVSILRLEPNTTIQLRLAARPGATGRPEEFLTEIGIDPYSVDIERIQIILSPLTEKAILP